MPAGMPFEDGAAIPVNYITAYHAMFTMGNLRSGDRILIHGAAGGVGIAAIQLAVAHGLEIFGTAGPSKQDYLRKIGVDHAIDYEKNNFVDVVRKFAPDGIEMVMDPIGGKSFANSYKMLSPIPDAWWFMAFPAAAGNDWEENLLRSVKALAGDSPGFPSAEIDEPEHFRDRREPWKAYDSGRPAARRTRRDFQVVRGGKSETGDRQNFSAG